MFVAVILVFAIILEAFVSMSASDLSRSAVPPALQPLIEATGPCSPAAFLRAEEASQCSGKGRGRFLRYCRSRNGYQHGPTLV